MSLRLRVALAPLLTRRPTLTTMPRACSRRQLRSLRSSLTTFMALFPPLLLLLTWMAIRCSRPGGVVGRVFFMPALDNRFPSLRCRGCCSSFAAAFQRGFASSSGSWQA